MAFISAELKHVETTTQISCIMWYITTSMKKWIDLRPYLLEEVCFTTTHGVFSSGAPFINQFWYYSMAQNMLWHQI
jgi:hypothetical protein